LATELETHQQYLDAVNQEGRVVILFTSPSWCAPCRAFEPHWRRVSENTEEIKFYEVRELLLDERQWAVVDCGVTKNPTCQLWQDGSFVRNVTVPQGGPVFQNDIRS